MPLGGYLRRPGKRARRGTQVSRIELGRYQEKGVECGSQKRTWWRKLHESLLFWRAGREGGGGRGFSPPVFVHSSRRTAQINLGLLESSRVSEGLVVALLIGPHTSTEFFFKNKKKTPTDGDSTAQYTNQKGRASLLGLRKTWEELDAPTWRKGEGDDSPWHTIEAFLDMIYSEFS